MQRTTALLLALTAALAAGPAHAASRFVVRGAGFGHGVGMSQYGAYGYAQHGKDHRFILAHYYTGTDLGQAPDGRVVRVLLQSGRRASFSAATRAGDRDVQPDSAYGVVPTALGRLELRSATGRRLATFDSPLRVSGDGPLTLAGAAANGVRDGAYRGTLEFRATAVGTLLVVDAVGLESYVRGVVGGEMPGSWPAEALEAQAVAARTYAITTGGNGADFDQYADTRSQMYRGVAAESPATDAAVAATSGQVVTYQGRPVATFFFSTSGGRTEDVQNSFLGSPPRPWLVSVADPYDDLSPKHRWGPFRMTLAQAGRKLRGLVKGSFRRISVVERGTSPRIVYADVVGTRGRTRVTGATLRARFGLFDTWATFTTITASGKATPDPDAAAPVSDAPPSDPQTGGVQPGGTTTSHTGGSARAAAYRLAGSVVGIVAPVRRRAHVRLERRAAGAWHPLAWLRPSRSGRYSFRGLRPGAYRVVWRGDTGPVVRL